MTRWIALLRITSCRYAAYYFLPFWVPFAEGMGRTPPLVAAILATVFWFVFSMGTETANRISDEEEDRINQPERTELCDLVGFGVLKKICVTSWVLSIAAWIATAWIQKNALLGGLLLAAIVAALGYSFGLRAKRMRYVANIFLAMPFVGTFITGWAVGHPHLERAEGAPGIGWFLLLTGVFSVTVGGVKDITDEKGDATVGYDSIWVSLRRSKARWSMGYVLSPYAALLALVASGGLPPRFLLLLPFGLFAVALAIWVRRARAPHEEHAVREVNYHYWYGFLTAALVLWHPQLPTVWAAVGAWTYWLLATRYLHWSGGFSRGRLRTLLDLVGAPAGEMLGGPSEAQGRRA